MAEHEHLVVVGASLAGMRAVGAARRSGFAGRISLVGAEPHLPYDRPPLSKAYLEADHEPEPPYLCDAEDHATHPRTDVLLGVPATALDTRSRLIEVGHREIHYDKVVIATGSVARKPLLAEGLRGVHVLRTIDDAVAIRRGLAAARSVVVVGAGFVGAEVASSARTRGCEVTIVEAAPAPLARALGAEMGVRCGTLHEANGTTLRCGVTVTAIEGRERRHVRLSDGSSVTADLVVVGVGADPATDWLARTDLELDNGVVCDEMLATSEPGVYAAGDVARWRNGWLDELMRREHWTTAAEQGEAAARNAVAPERAKPYTSVPYVWTDWYGVRIQFLGVCDGDETRVVSGSPEEHRFVALYRRGDRLAGVLAMDEQAEVMKYRRLLRSRARWTDALAFAQTRRTARAA